MMINHRRSFSRKLTFSAKLVFWVISVSLFEDGFGDKHYGGDSSGTDADIKQEPKPPACWLLNWGEIFHSSHSSPPSGKPLLNEPTDEQNPVNRRKAGMMKCRNVLNGVILLLSRHSYQNLSENSRTNKTTQACKPAKVKALIGSPPKGFVDGEKDYASPTQYRQDNQAQDLFPASLICHVHLL